MKKPLFALLTAALCLSLPAAALFEPVNLSAPGTHRIDLDGDGVENVIVIQDVPDEDGELTSTLTIDGVEHPFLFVCESGITVVDLDETDAHKELIATGDVMSSDYITECLRFAGGQIVSVPFLNPLIDPASPMDFFDGSVRVEADAGLTGVSRMDILGTRFWTRPLTLSADRACLEPAPGTSWTHDAQYAEDAEELYADDLCLIVARALPVVLLENGSETRAVLPVGAKLLPRETDGLTRFGFTTETGQSGYITVSDSDEFWGKIIEGVHESEWFEFVPYAD